MLCVHLFLFYSFALLNGPFFVFSKHYDSELDQKEISGMLYEEGDSYKSNFNYALTGGEDSWVMIDDGEPSRKSLKLKAKYTYTNGPNTQVIDSPGLKNTIERYKKDPSALKKIETSVVSFGFSETDSINTALPYRFRRTLRFQPHRFVQNIARAGLHFIVRLPVEDRHCYGTHTVQLDVEYMNAATNRSIAQAQVILHASVDQERTKVKRIGSDFVTLSGEMDTMLVTLQLSTKCPSIVQLNAVRLFIHDIKVDIPEQHSHCAFPAHAVFPQTSLSITQTTTNDVTYIDRITSLQASTPIPIRFQIHSVSFPFPSDKSHILVGGHATLVKGASARISIQSNVHADFSQVSSFHVQSGLDTEMDVPFSDLLVFSAPDDLPLEVSITFPNTEYPVTLRDLYLMCNNEPCKPYGVRVPIDLNTSDTLRLDRMETPIYPSKATLQEFNGSGNPASVDVLRSRKGLLFGLVIGFSVFFFILLATALTAWFRVARRRDQCRRYEQFLTDDC